MNTRTQRKKRCAVVTEEMFDKVKVLASYKSISNHQISDITKLGVSTIGRIKSCDDYTLYKAHIADLKARHNERHKPAEVPSFGLEDVAPEWVEPEQPKPDVQERIAIALERLADAWEARPQGRTGIFR